MKKHLLITILTFFLASPLAWANDLYYNIKQEFSVSKIQTELQAIINNAFVNDNIVVTGSKTDADATLTLTIPAGKKVVWQALFQATSNFTPNTLLMFLGDGTFEVAGGKLTSPAAMTINSYGDNATVVVSSGTVSATFENAIITRGTNAKVYISGGEVSNISEGKYPVIYMYNQENTKQNVVVSGSAKIEALGAKCISTSGRVIIGGNARLSSPQTPSFLYTAIFSSGLLEIKENAKITGNIGMNIGMPDSVIVRDNAEVSGDIYAIKVFVRNKGKVNGSIQASDYVEITDNAQIVSTSYCAIKMQGWGDESIVTVSGGLVFAQRENYGVICSPDSISIAENAMLLAWNSDAGNREYKMFDIKDISKYPESATAYWTKKEGKNGIFYANGDNTGFIPIEEVTVLSVTEHALSKVSVYPNPTAGELQVTSYELHVTSVEVFDVLGRKQCLSYAQQPKGEGEVVVDISHLPVGIYFVKIETENGMVVRKIVKK